MGQFRTQLLLRSGLGYSVKPDVTRAPQAEPAEGMRSTGGRWWKASKVAEAQTWSLLRITQGTPC